ncbi:hypothetical protein N7456_011512 [Penicillium angulare]|uniref:Uncharacterized protein n=1 Tax=Penicillium angulare TaxID=116970 RepID=A0A9W9EU61_9EURO|nr:hypothetical protein N7456_011512 [Penicillium angulare]
MPRRANLRTRSTEYEYGQLPYNYNAYGESDATECKFPPFPEQLDETWKRNFVWGILGGAFFIIASFIGVAIAFTVIFATKSPNPSGYSYDSAGYALYKNTRLEECYSTPASTLNCTGKQASLNNTKIPGFAENNVGYLANSKGLTDWCEVIGCFSDYKVIPSKPRESAIWPNFLTSWTTSAGFIIGSLLQLLLQQKALYSKKKKVCKRGISEIHWYSWPFIAFDLYSFVSWWYSFGKLAAAPDSAATPFIIGWVIPWKYAGLFRYHPYSCAFRGKRRRQNIARSIFYILAAIRWIASLYVFHINSPSTMYGSWGLRAPNPSYDCVQSQIDAAPGLSTCSATQICARKWLFVDPGFEPQYLHMDPTIAIWTIFFGLMVAVIFPFGITLIAFIFENIFQRRKSSGASLWSVFRWADPGPVIILSFLSAFSIIAGAILVGDMVKRLSTTPVAAVTFDWECQTMHVTLSPWRYYLDVDYERGWRIATSWFNS